MNKRIHLWPVIIMVLSCILFLSCKKDECISNSYALQETWKVTPEKDSIIVGDTLYFVSQFSNKPFDYISNKSVDLSGSAIINTTLGVYVLKSGASNFGSAIDSFQFIPVKGRVETAPNLAPDHIKQIYHEEFGGEYIISFKIIALKRGIYVFGFSDGLARRKNASSCEDGGGIGYVNSNANNHFYFVEQFYGTTNLPSGEREHSYSFKVK